MIDPSVRNPAAWVPPLLLERNVTAGQRSFARGLWWSRAQLKGGGPAPSSLLVSLAHALWGDPEGGSKAEKGFTGWRLTSQSVEEKGRLRDNNWTGTSALRRGSLKSFAFLYHCLDPIYRSVSSTFLGSCLHPPIRIKVRKLSYQSKHVFLLAFQIKITGFSKKV